MEIIIDAVFFMGKMIDWRVSVILCLFLLWCSQKTINKFPSVLFFILSMVFILPYFIVGMNILFIMIVDTTLSL
ncbi:hypothetical protein OO7_07549 [Providencia sneebia DSM 19967]|uniref:Uncharacterized protein n=1 Tax=Providencia sneebia DSM 19967 TaxID=1141660 RepID=K8WM48_9GAMM|nr:hypothetical protein OO7_07549 [Providencia sneebia DSM 19967]